VTLPVMKVKPRRVERAALIGKARRIVLSKLSTPLAIAQPTMTIRQARRAL
jgi:hypothetical protein